MSASHSLPIPKKAPRSEGEGIHAELMRAIGSKSYDPMPSTQHRWLMDVSNPPRMQIMGYLYSVTIGADRDLRRWAFAREARGPIKAARVAAEFGWSVARTNVYLRELEETGHIRLDENGWIWLGGEVQEPRRRKGEYPKKADVPDSGEKDQSDLWPYISDKPFSLYLQQLSENEADRETRDAARAAARRVLQLEELENRAIADAKAMIRAEIKAKIDAEKRSVKFPVAEGRGRPAKERSQPVVQLTLLSLTNYGHKSAPINGHNSKTTSGQKENSYGQNVSYIEEQSTETEKPFSASPSASEMNERKASASPYTASPEAPTPPPAAFVSNQPAQDENLLDDIDTVSAAVRAESIQPDTSLVQQIVEQTRRNDAGVSAQDIAEAIKQKGPQARKAANPAGFLFRVIPKLFEKGAKAWRESLPTAAPLTYVERLLQGEE